MATNAMVTWLGPKSIMLPNTFQYITVARFKEDQEAWQREAWSVALEFAIPPVKQGNPSYGEARFLVKNAPKGRLVPGTVFEMFEGEEKTARVEILRE